MKKKLAIVLFSLIALALCAIYFTQQYFLPRKEHKVTIIRDIYGIPHIYGETDADVMFGFGYAQAEDHLLDMIFNYLTATGRLSEFYGKKYLKSDFIVHLFGVPEAASKYREQLSGEVIELIEAFYCGVNKYIEEHLNELPAELQSYRVTVKDVVAWCYYIQLSRPLGDAFKELNVSIGYKIPLVADYSNECALAPWKTAVNATMLLGDPHLPWYGMNRWYEAHLIGDKLNVYGATFYGVPFIIIGFNDKIAWTFTRNSVDLADIFIEKLNPSDPRKYLIGNKWLELKEKIIEIRVKTSSGYEYYKQKVYYSIHGPVVHVDLERLKAYSVALEGIEVLTFIEQLYRMNTARNLKEFISALKLRGVLLWNILYADVEGNIFYLYNARIHVKSEKYHPEKPRPGWLEDAQWGETYPFEKLPSILNPKSGFIQNNNVAPWNTTVDHGLNPADYPVYLVEGRGTNDRGIRAFNVLKEARNFTVEDALALATDTYLIRAEKYIPLILEAAKNKSLSGELKKAVELLGEWDYRADANSTAITIFYYWWKYYTKTGDIWESLVKAVDFIKRNYGRIEVKWGEVHVIERGGVRLPLSGGTKGLPALWMATGPVKNNIMVCNSGSSFTMLVVLKKNNVTAYTLIPYGESEDPSSKHYMDQMFLKSRSKLKKVFFYYNEVVKYSERTTVLYFKS
ncbi:MAG: hypothetical protein DRN04_04475 [Thermoprotei archaeon]|nr:MAG: hypothetical protein DRN04_04475 [Thermoprotei archaeon]